VSSSSAPELLILGPLVPRGIIRFDLSSIHIESQFSINLRIVGNKLRVEAIIDPEFDRAKNVLRNKISGTAKSAYANTKIYQDLSEYTGIAPHAIFIGVPPAVRGTLDEGRNMELIVSKKFPDSALFVEKPISSSYPTFVEPLVAHFKQAQSFVAVGYMLRYLKGT
jgi:Oxidoreductase family, NAD-binding Rossmann fold